MIGWKKKQKILVFDGDFPSVIVALKNTASLFNLKIIMHDIHLFQTDKEAALKKIEKALKQGVKLVAVSYVLFQTGFRMPISEITRLCHKYGAQIFVDAAQAFGAIPFNVTELGVDYLVAPTHKWLLGVEGCGVIYVSPNAMKKLIPRKTGWLSYNNSLDFLNSSAPMRYDLDAKSTPSITEIGVGNCLGLAALESGIAYHIHHGINSIHQHVQKLYDILENELTKLGFVSSRSPLDEERSNILAFTPPSKLDIIDIYEFLLSCGIFISIPNNYIRFSAHCHSNHEDISYTIASLEKLIDR